MVILTHTNDNQLHEIQNSFVDSVMVIGCVFLNLFVLLVFKVFCFSFLSVEKVANESQKTPRDVVMMENFHHIFATLSRLKISCLEAEKKEAKQKYTDHLQSYVIYSLGQPLEKLNVSIFEYSFKWYTIVFECIISTI